MDNRKKTGIQTLRQDTGRHKVDMDMVNGPLLGKLIRFSIPVMLSGLLQLLFNAADIVVVGRYTGSDALAAVGASGPITSLIVTLFMGLSVGANVLAAQAIGRADMKDLEDTVHTSVASSVFLGAILSMIGIVIAKPLLHLIKTPDNILPLAHRYLWIYFLAMPASLLYNFGAAILRAAGNTQKPLYYLAISGATNVILNLFFVLALKMGVSGVALATTLSQYLAAGMVTLDMLRTDAAYKLIPSKLAIHQDKLIRMFRFGIPAGLQGSAFSIANLLIQSSINSFGPAVMAATTAAWNIDGFCNVAIDAFAQAAISFTGQNYGAGKYDRIDKVLAICLAVGCGMGMAAAIVVIIFSPQLLSIYTKDAEVIEHGRRILFIVATTQFINCTMNVPFNVERGMGYSVFPMVAAILSICVFRVIWIYTIFQAIPTVTVLFLSYPVTKGLASVVALVFYFHVRKKLRAQQAA